MPLTIVMSNQGLPIYAIAECLLLAQTGLPEFLRRSLGEIVIHIKAVKVVLNVGQAVRMHSADCQRILLLRADLGGQRGQEGLQSGRISVDHNGRTCSGAVNSAFTRAVFSRQDYPSGRGAPRICPKPAR